jgi:hypothetical protein
MFSGHLYREGELITLASAYQALTRDDQKQPPLFSVAG